MWEIIRFIKYILKLYYKSLSSLYTLSIKYMYKKMLFIFFPNKKNMY